MVESCWNRRLRHPPCRCGVHYLHSMVIPLRRLPRPASYGRRWRADGARVVVLTSLWSHLRQVPLCLPLWIGLIPHPPRRSSLRWYTGAAFTSQGASTPLSLPRKTTGFSSLASSVSNAVAFACPTLGSTGDISRPSCRRQLRLVVRRLARQMTFLRLGVLHV